jgi:glycosyltransferase involved in cell wall biosynthesis
MTELAAVSTLQTQPMRVAPDRPELSTVTVLQFGPGLSVRGGISAVERLIVEHLPTHGSASALTVRHVPTMEEGSLLRKAVVFTRAVLTLRALLTTSEPFIVHIHFASRGSTLRKILLARMVQRAGRPLILHAHGGGFESFYRRLPRVAREFTNDTLQRANSVVVLSNHWRAFYIEQCELTPAQVTVLPNPARVPGTVPERRGRTRVQFLYLGRMSESKGTFDLVRAFAALDAATRARAQLVLAGDGDLEGIARLSRPLGAAVLVLPWVRPATRDRLLAESDVFVLPSYREGMPMALLEAMASGLPAITTAVGGIPDVMEDGGQGIFVQPGDVNGLSAALEAMIRDEPRRLELGRHARERAARFDVAGYMSRLQGLYQRVAPITKLKAFA